MAQRPDPGVTRYQTRNGQQRWRVTYDLLPSPDGERRRTTKRGFRTVTEANRFRRDALSRHEQGLGHDPARGRQRLADYMRAWLEGLSVKPTTRADYRQSIECYIVPRIGGVRLEQLTPEHLDRLYRGLEANGKRRGACRTDGRTCEDDGCSSDLHDGLKAKSVRNVHGCLHVALEAAAERGYVPRNVADLANPPKAKRARSRNPRDNCWTRDQLVTFLDHCRDETDRLYALWFLIATTGLRRAETLALRWSDVDLDDARLTIRETVTVADGVVVWQDDAKSDESERTIALDVRTLAALRDHRKRQLEERLAIGPAWSTDKRDRDLVFTRPDGASIPPRRASQMFTRRVDAAGLPRVGVHGLRHTWATLALRAGVPVKVVSERIGHADPAVTMQVYAHALEGDDAAAAEVTAAAIFGD
ncbi:MAG: site-specific integrase [Actinomycetota bacterium]|nr:site-specific integrase [Actinomycetota bacterium]